MVYAVLLYYDAAQVGAGYEYQNTAFFVFVVLLVVVVVVVVQSGNFKFQKFLNVAMIGQFSR
jgi:hypothetical protein